MGKQYRDGPTGHKKVISVILQSTCITTLHVHVTYNSPWTLWICSNCSCTVTLDWACCFINSALDACPSHCTVGVRFLSSPIYRYMCTCISVHECYIVHVQCTCTCMYTVHVYVHNVHVRVHVHVYQTWVKLQKFKYNYTFNYRIS